MNTCQNASPASPYALSEETLSQQRLGGQVFDPTRDPPGQRSVYIPPGEEYKESYRLGTFSRYATEVLVNIRALAKNGFLYTGYRDRIKCYSCGRCVEKFQTVGHLSSVQDWHKSDCDFKNGNDSINEPIPSFLRTRTVTNSNTAPNTVQNNIFAPSAAVGNNPGRQSTRTQTPPVVHQTAHVVPQTPPVSPYRLVDLAGIADPQHEQLIRSLDMRKEADRRETYKNPNWPRFTNHMQSLCIPLAKSGFFYLGNLDRVQCFTCGGVLRNWNDGDIAHTEHQRHFPQCKMVLDNQPHNVPLPPGDREYVSSQPTELPQPPNLSESEQQELARMFPCNNPVNGHMRNENNRRETYTYGNHWDRSGASQTPDQLAKAGFFYVGNRDQVKCWYCDGGLQGWREGEVPWIEHAKWMPTCEFLHSQTGPDFVHAIVSAFPNLPRPILRSPVYNVPGNASREPNVHQSRPPIIDPGEGRRKKAEMENKLKTTLNSFQNSIREILSSFEPGKAAKCIVERYGDSQQVLINNIISKKPTDTGAVAVVLQQLFSLENGDFCKSADNKCSEHQDDESQSVSEQENNSSNAVSTVASNAPEDEEMEVNLLEDTSSALNAQMRNSQEERLCKICLDKPYNIVFQPCGHLAVCKDCSDALRKCPICRDNIDSRLVIYMA